MPSGNPVLWRHGDQICGIVQGAKQFRGPTGECADVSAACCSPAVTRRVFKTANVHGELCLQQTVTVERFKIGTPFSSPPADFEYKRS